MVFTNQYAKSQTRKCDAKALGFSYSNSKAFKLSNQNIAAIVKIQNKKGFKNDSEVVRFCIDFMAVLIERGLETQALAKLVESVANEK